MKNKFTDYALRLEGQPMFRLLDEVKKLESRGQRIIHFEIGDPDFATPERIVDACVKALYEGETHYTSSSGLIALREAIAEYTQRDLGFMPMVNQILVSPGANPLIYFVIQCLVNRDEEVIVPDPAFSTYYSVLKFLDLKAVCVPLREENHFRMNTKDLRRAITPKTKLIIINSPQNPTGSIMSQEEIDEVYAIAEEHDLYILSDEIYRHMSYEDVPASVCIHDRCRERTILMTGFSKTFAMTGWRLGYMIGPEELVEKISLLVQTIISCVPTFIQKAGISVLKDQHPQVVQMTSALKQCRNLTVAGLNNLPGVSCLKPQGAFYAFANIRNTHMTSEEFAQFMLQEANVALLPGTNFGEHGEGYVRLCYATSQARIEEGLKRMQAALEKKMIFV